MNSNKHNQEEMKSGVTSSDNHLSNVCEGRSSQVELGYSNAEMVRAALPVIESGRSSRGRSLVFSSRIDSRLG